MTPSNSDLRAILDARDAARAALLRNDTDAAVHFLRCGAALARALPEKEGRDVVVLFRRAIAKLTEGAPA